MAVFTFLKSARYPLGSTIMRRSGEVVDVADSDVDGLVGRGVIALGEAEPAVKPASKPVAIAPAPAPKPDKVKPARGKYGKLPLKSAPKAAWVEYAKKHKIDIQGLSRKNDVMAFVMRTVGEQ